MKTLSTLRAYASRRVSSRLKRFGRCRTMLGVMMAQSVAAKTVAGIVVAEMVRRGCDAQLMEKHGITESTYFWILGGNHWSEDPSRLAEQAMGKYREDFIKAPTVKLSHRAK